MVTMYTLFDPHVIIIENLLIYFGLTKKITYRYICNLLHMMVTKMWQILIWFLPTKYLV